MQTASRESVAYDYSRFDNRKRVREAVRSEHKPVKRQVRQKTNLFPTFLVCGAALCVLCVIVYNYMQVTILSDEAAKLKKEYTKLQEEETILRAQQEKNFNLSYVEEYAKDSLNMYKLDKSQIEFIDANSTEKIEVFSAEEKKTSHVMTGLIKTFNAVVEYLN